MGRKPNQLILHYFHRGQKLEDASNRYQHTCKACSEVFPKGRIDGLQNHLIRRCPALSVEERTQILMQVHQIAPASHTQIKKAAKGRGSRPGNLAQQNHTPQQTFDGLNVLAEASRQVTQVERRGSQSYPVASAANDDLNMAIDPSLDVFPSSFPNTFDHELGTFAQTNVPQSHNTIPPLPHLPNEHPEDDSNAHTIGSPHGDGVDVPMSSQPENELSTIAAGASELLPQGHQLPTAENDAARDADARRESEHGVGTPADDAAEQTEQDSGYTAAAPDENGTSPTTNKSNEHFNYDGPNLQAFWEGIDRETARTLKQGVPLTQSQRPIAMRSQMHTGEFGEFTLDPAHTPKTIRQKFSSDRRKEVQHVRKIGACVRCRMLRKCCDGGSPCASCRSVENARLWKDACIRVKLVELFDLYAAGVAAKIAYQDLNVLKFNSRTELSNGEIYVTHIDHTIAAISFKGLSGYYDGSVAASLIFNISYNPSHVPNAEDVRFMDGEGDDQVNKIGKYLLSQGPAIRETESSPIVRTSLEYLAKYSEESHDTLVEETLELWAATQILCERDSKWKMTYLSGVTQETNSIDEHSDKTSYSIIVAQLHALVEKRAALLNKKVLQHLEGKLMHNKRSFDVFLVSLIILNCVERMSWFFTCWATDAHISSWPLEQPPSDYCIQAERFAEILCLLLRMRVVPPKTSPRPDTGILVPVDVGNESMKEWFATAQVTVENLLERQRAELKYEDSRCFDLKFASKILLPANAYT